MSEPFDPYRKWLGIPPKDQPPNHYRLLGIATFESDPDVIENAAARQMAHIRTFQGGRHAALSQRLLTELSAAKICLLMPAEKEPYDARLREKLQAEGKLSSEAPLGPAVLAVAVPVELPPMPSAARGLSPRWRTEAVAELPPVVAPPVPIPLPVGTAVPAIPAVHRSSASAYRGRKKHSPLPLAIVVVCGLLLIGGGIFAAVALNNQSQPTTKSHPHKPPAAAPAIRQTQPPANLAPQGGSGSTPLSSHELPPRRPREHQLPLKAYSPASSEFPLGIPESATPEPAPIPGSATNPADDAALPAVDRLRQQLFLARQALSQRDNDATSRHLALAEQIAAEPGLEESLRFQLKEDIEHLRNLQALIDQFWKSVGENLASQFKPGEPFGLFQARVELVSLEGETVKYKFNDQEHESPLRAIDPVAAALVAGKTAKITEPATLMPILAFLSIDEAAAQKHAEDNVVKFARRFFSENKLAGQRNLEIAARLGIKLATDLPLP